MTNFFKQSYTRVNEVFAETTAKVLISLLDDAFSKNSLIKSEDLYTNFTLIMEGPFICFIKKRSISQGISHDHMHSYIFSPHYMVKRNLFNYSIHFIPNHHLINSSIDILFTSEIDCKIWFDKIIKIRKILKDAVKIIPPVLTSANLYIPQVQIPITCEMSIMNGQISFHGSERNPSIPKPIKITKDLIVMSTYESDSVPPESKGLSFAIAGKGVPELTVCVGSTDLLEFCFMTIFTTTEAAFRQRSPQSGRISFAAAVPARKAAPVWPSPDLTSSLGAFSCALNYWAPSSRADGIVAVPEKASSHLEILVFDAPIARRVVACRSAKEVVRRRPPPPREERASLADQLGLLLSLPTALPLHSPSSIRARRGVAPFSPRQLPPHVPGPSISQAALSLLSEKGIQCEGDNLSLSLPLPGETVAAELSRRVSEVPLRFDAGGAEFSSLVSLVASIVSSGIGKAIAIPDGPLAPCVPHAESSPLAFCAVLFARAVARKRLREFIEWAFSASQNGLMAVPEFAELFGAALRPMAQKECRGRFVVTRAESVEVEEEDDSAVRSFCAVLAKSMAGGKAVRDCVNAIAGIVCRTASFLHRGFLPPQRAPVPALARPWAAVAATASESADLALKAAVERLTVSAPGHELSRLVLTGLRCGRAAQWVAEVAAAMRRGGSAKGALLDDRRVASIVDSLLSLSGVFIELTDEEVLSSEGLMFV